MLAAPFSHSITRKLIVAFGQLFSNIKIQRMNNLDVLEQLIDVPISYGNREKWYRRLQEEAELDQRVLITLPRIGFEITGFRYDSSRRLNKLTQFRKCTPTANGNFLSAYAPVPYKIGLTMYVMTKTQEDMFQIIEQIIPYFGPQYNLAINAVPGLGIVQNVPINLDGVDFHDSYEGPMVDRREIVATLSFTANVEYLGPISDDASSIILHTKVKIDPQSGSIAREVDTDVVGDPAGVYAITEDFFDIPRPID